MTDTVAQAIFGVVVPLVLGAGAGMFGARAVREDGRARLAWRLPLAAGLPVAIAFACLFGKPSEAWHHLMYVPIVGAAGGALMALSRRGLVQLGLFVVAAAAATACAWPVLERESWFVKGGAFGAAVVLGVLVECLLRRRPGPSVLFGLGLAATAAAAIVFASGFLTLAVPAGAFAVALVGVAFAALVRSRSMSAAHGVVAVVAPVMVIFPLTAWLYGLVSDPLPTWCFVLPSLAPLAMWLVELAPKKVREGGLGAVLRIVLVLAVCLAAGAGALRGEEEAGEEDPYADIYKDMMG